MTEVTSQHEAPLPAVMPMLLSFVAGYVDSYSYLTLFGLFVAQVTGSFVIGSAELVSHDTGIVGKVLAIVAFVLAAAATAALIALARGAGRAALPWMLALEAALLAAFVAMVLFGPAIQSAADWHGIVAGLFAAMAMGAQSVLVRLLMKGIPQTNVMTGNMTQLGIETTEIVLAWRRRARQPHDRQAMEDFAKARERLRIVAAVALGFLAGAAVGAAAFAVTNVRGAMLAVAIVVVLALWTFYRENSAKVGAN
jgi:uncharacterized membrane protein YoaK (UPF0700 family)